MAGGGGGKEGDWDCSGCRNKNYAFRTFCNRCKQPRIVVDTKTPSDSKWLPRIGDWICTGCTNNNYASREKCKKCGQPKGITAMPAVALAGASVPTHPPYFVRAPGGMQRLLIGGPLQPSRSLSSSWPLAYTGQYGNQATVSYGPRSASNWHFGGYSTGISYAGETSSLPPVPNGNEWRTGDWMCTCGFHNYTSRIQCKKCNTLKPNSTPAPLLSPASTALGTKRLASEEFIHNWDNDGQQTVLGFNSYPGVAQFKKMRAANSGGNTVNPVNLQVNHPRVPSLPMTPALFGKGAKHWQNGDWICSNCNNHNYASRAQCNRCKSDRDVPSQRVSVA